MLWIMLALTGAGVLLLLGGPAIARLLASREWAGIRDPGGLARLLQIAGVGLLVAALLFRPHNPETSAFPPPSAQISELRLTR